jgi:hypothetical protein
MVKCCGFDELGKKDAKIVEICKKFSRKCRVFLSFGDFPSLMRFM